MLRLCHVTCLSFRSEIHAREEKRGRRLRTRVPREESRYKKKGIRMAFRFPLSDVSHNPSIPLLSRCFCARGRVIYYTSLLPLPIPLHPSVFARSCSTTPFPRSFRRESVRYRCRRDTGVVRGIVAPWGG